MLCNMGGSLDNNYCLSPHCGMNVLGSGLWKIQLVGVYVRPGACVSLSVCVCVCVCSSAFIFVHMYTVCICVCFSRCIWSADCYKMPTAHIFLFIFTSLF